MLIYVSLWAPACTQEQPKSCKEAALALLVCMQKGECMKKGGTVKECLKSTDVEDCTVREEDPPPQSVTGP